MTYCHHNASFFCCHCSFSWYMDIRNWTNTQNLEPLFSVDVDEFFFYMLYNFYVFFKQTERFDLTLMVSEIKSPKWSQKLLLNTSVFFEYYFYVVFFLLSSCCLKYPTDLL
jgi:hypothetical protein